MSASIKAAIAAKRAAASTSPTKEESGFTITPLGSPKKQPKSDLQEELKREMEAALSVSQQTEESALSKACSSGRLVLSSRSPALARIPPSVYSLLGEDTPSWYSQATQSPWYDRADVTSLILSTNEIEEVEDKIGQFELLQRVDLHSNKLNQLPSSISHLTNMKHLILSRNRFSEFPSSLLTLDNLVSLDLSYNNLTSLWKDSDILSSREVREKWEKENAEEEGGVWAGLIAKTGSPVKKIGPPQPFERSLPLRSLRSLNLSNNKLKNFNFGIKSTLRRKGNVEDEEPVDMSFPPRINSLDLSDNLLSGPLELKAFKNLEELKHLALGGNGISDDVFLPLVVEGEGSEINQVLKNLQNLDLSRCEIDDLTKIETFFASSRTRALGEEESEESKTDSESEPTPIAAVGVLRRQLIRAPGQQPETSINPFNAPPKSEIPQLFVILERNPLREELFRRKRGPSTLAGGRTVRAVSSGVTDAVNGAGSSSKDTAAAESSSSNRTSPPIHDAFIDPAIASQGIARPISTSQNPSLPAKPAPAKEEWEIQAEQGLMSEGARRRMRAEAARREREASSDAAATSSNELSRGRGKNTTGLSDWDGEPAPTSGSRSRGRGTSKSRTGNNGTGNDQDGDEEDFLEGDESLLTLQEGSTALSTAKLSTKKKEALGQVPCKFFRSAGCSAQDSCPFAHTMPGEGIQKATCQWYLKGSCRFGHKCALAHVLPGQPISMDRKNKRAAQQAQSGKGGGGGAANGASGSGGARKERGEREDAQWDQHATHQQGGNGAQFANGGHRDHDFPFGLPDDMMSPGYSQTNQVQDPSYGQVNGNGSREASSSSLHRSLLAGEANTSPSQQRPMSVPRGTNTTPSRSTAMDRGRVSMDAGIPVGSPSAFGTSPFSHPGGHSLFFGSQDDEGAGPFARMSHNSRSMGQFEDSQARARWYGSVGVGGAHAREEELGGDLNEEDFVPSSLSDLLTPAELERRGRSSRSNAQPSLSTSTQSMPAQGGGQGSLWDLNLRTNGPSAGDDLLSTSNHSAAFLSNGRNYEDASYSIGRLPLGPESRVEPAGLGGMGSVQLGGQAYSHAPGQSLPQGLAAGLSRLHLGSSSGGVAEAMRNANSGDGSSAIGPGSSNPLLSVSGTASNQTLTSSLGMVRLQAGMRMDSYGNGSNYEELGPIAPSSILPHRPSPLSLAASRSQTNSYGQSLSNSHHSAFGTSPFSATGSVGGAFPSSFGNNNNNNQHQDGIAVPSSPSNSQPHSGGMHMLSHPRKRPEMDRIRSGAPPPGSPLSYPTKEESEMEEEAIFELE